MCVFCVNVLCAQEQAIKMSNPTLEKEFLTKENKRIRIKTTDGKRISGRFTLEEDFLIINN